MYIGRIKERARDALQYNWGTAIIASLVASICGVQGASASFTFNFGGSEPSDGTDMGDTGTLDTGALDTYFEENLQIIIPAFVAFFITALIVAAVMFCLGSIVSVGYQKFNLDLVDGTCPGIGTLFTYFSHWKNLILTNLLSTVYISLYSLLFIIPGLVATYKYAMVPYILAEDPELKPQAAHDKSAEMMRGHKWDLFRLQMSFIGWTFLCMLSRGIGFIWLIPYMNASYAEFYRQITRTPTVLDTSKFTMEDYYDMLKNK